MLLHGNYGLSSTSLASLFAEFRDCTGETDVDAICALASIGLTAAAASDNAPSARELVHEHPAVAIMAIMAVMRPLSMAVMRPHHETSKHGDHGNHKKTRYPLFTHGRSAPRPRLCCWRWLRRGDKRGGARGGAMEGTTSGARER